MILLLWDEMRQENSKLGTIIIQFKYIMGVE